MKKRWLSIHVNAQNLGKQVFGIYFSGLLLQDVTLFPGSMVAEKKLLRMCGKHFLK